MSFVAAIVYNTHIHTHTRVHARTDPYTAYVSFYNREDSKNNKKEYWLYFCMTTKNG